MYKLSVIVPVYNSEKYIKRCLDSLISQSYQELEIILVDDGSTDESTKICEEYVRMDQRFKFYYKENGGAGSARKEALKYAKGDYITCVDADDWIEQKTYEDLMAIANRNKPDLIACSFIKEFVGFQTTRNDYPEEGYYGKDKFYDVMKSAGENMPFFCQVISGSLCCKVFKKALYEKYQNLVPSEIVLSEDLAVVLPMLFDIEDIYICKKPYYHYCQNKESSSWVWRNGEYERLQTLADYLKNYYNKYDDVVYRRLILHSIYFAMMDLLYDIPADYFKNGIPFLKCIEKKSKVVVYGKGVYASNLVNIIKRYDLCELVLNVDSSDADVLFSKKSQDYDYVVISVLDCMIVEKIESYLIENGISPDKIVRINKEYLTKENLPKEIGMLIE